jgi:hypothetical protein
MSISHTLTATALSAAALVLATSAVPAAQASTTSAAPPAERAARAHVVKAAVNRAAVVQGRRVVVHGTVRSGERGDRVKVQVRYAGGTWQRTALTDRLDRHGRFAISDRIATGRTRAYRVVKPAGDGRRAGRSEPVRVTVYSWRDLSSFPSVTRQDTWDGRAVKINAVAYPGSVVADPRAASGSIAYNLERRCRQLETRVGVADTSAETATGRASLKLDGTERFTGSYTLTRSSTLALALDDVFRLTFDWTSTNSAGTPEDQSGAHVALGSPRVLCHD